MTKILVVDDERTLRGAVCSMLRGAGYEVEEASDGNRAIEQAGQSAYDVVLTDLKMGGLDGLAVLRRIRELQPLTEVIVMTAYGTIESAVDAMRAGAYDYIQKPFTEEELLMKLAKAIEKRQLGTAYALMAQEFRDRYKFDNIIGRSGAIRDVIARVVKISASDATVLITGESGTGKEMVAKAIHANSRRSNKPFVTVNCAAMTETLIESELFGHSKGAFTGATKDRKGLFEEANGATFFFDEVAETTPSFQAKLLRAIQEGEVRRVGETKPIFVDVRIVAATNQDLQRAIAEKRFRQDLYYRLNVVRFLLPPLRERKEDVPQLVEHFLAKIAKKTGQRAKLGEGVLEYLLAYDYPGNIRELENMIEQGVALSARTGVIQLEDVAPQDMILSSPDESAAHSRTLTNTVDQAEREAIISALREFDGNRERAAELLGLSTTTLWRKMKRLNVVWSNT
ncbi:MAG: sigma-54 dependent transcriptional regulator [Deltaproteobacteria bacterium]|nr:sigma-54 dependent transcriptional regulator [Deltaproteobacteria bacterium]